MTVRKCDLRDCEFDDEQEGSVMLVIEKVERILDFDDSSQLNDGQNHEKLVRTRGVMRSCPTCAAIDETLALADYETNTFEILGFVPEKVEQDQKTGTNKSAGQ